MTSKSKIRFQAPSVGNIDSAGSVCPICSSDSLADVIHRSRLPTLQNRVYSDRNDALACPKGVLTISCCGSCGFAFNRTFEPDLVKYDGYYDNTVPSGVFDSYYDEIGDALYTEYSLAGKTIVDIGCGKGEFLRRMVTRHPDVSGLGIDPSFEPDRMDMAPNLRFFAEPFAPALIADSPDLIVCRHVLEHIPNPVGFLRDITGAISEHKPIPVLIEVPDTDWILDNKAYWDFYYEHCNYFTADSLAYVCRRAKLQPFALRRTFNGQYLQIFAKIGSEPSSTNSPPNDDSRVLNAFLKYHDVEASLIRNTRAWIDAKSRGEHRIAIWGMASKGIIFSLLMGDALSKVTELVDINPKKQNQAVPLIGRMIVPPDRLVAHDAPWYVIAMNPNYSEEIREQCKALGLDASIVDPAEIAG